MTEPAAASRASRIALAIGAYAYAGFVVSAGMNPGPRAWAFHSAGFLPLEVRVVVFACLLAGAGLLLTDAVRPPRGAATTPRNPTPKRTRVALPTSRLLPVSLLVLAAIFTLLRARTQFLGDGTVWLAGLQAGVVTAKSEPLSAALWLGATQLLRALGLPIAAHTVAYFPVLCGLAAAAFAWGIAREVTPQRQGIATALTLLLTLGVTQLFCGYIESYAPVAAFVLGFLWLGLRHVRGGGPSILLPVAFACCLASHFATAILGPSYLLLALRGPGSRARRFALAAAGPALAVALLVLLGSNPNEWLHSLGTAARGAEAGNMSTTSVEPAYGVFSFDHLVDFMNALFLILPVPLLLLIAGLVERRGRFAPLAPDTMFLALAAVPGLGLAALLRLPLPFAQDWDLMGILLLPAAVFAIRAGLALPRSPRRNEGLVVLSIGAILPFLLVNASEGAAIRRFETILAPDARITSFGRAYGNYALWSHFSGRGDNARAYVYSVRALESERGNPRYWTNVGLDLYRLKRYDEALPYLEEGAKRGPNLWVSRYDLGLCLKEKERYAEAAAEFGIAARIGGERPEVLHNLGIALFRSGHPDSAIAIWREVAARWPEYTSALQQGSAPPP